LCQGWILLFRNKGIKEKNGAAINQKKRTFLVILLIFLNVLKNKKKYQNNNKQFAIGVAVALYFLETERL